jgi:hypothetical protein
VPDRRVVVTPLGVAQILAWVSSFYLLGVLANRDLYKVAGKGVSNWRFANGG